MCTVIYICIRGKKITCPGAQDKLNFRQDKHIFSPNVRRTSKQENTHTGADSSSVNNIPLLSDYQHCNIICYCKEHDGQKYVLKKLT